MTEMPQPNGRSAPLPVVALAWLAGAVALIQALLWFADVLGEVSLIRRGRPWDRESTLVFLSFAWQLPSIAAARWLLNLRTWARQWLLCAPTAQVILLFAGGLLEGRPLGPWLRLAARLQETPIMGVLSAAPLVVAFL